MPYTRTSTRVRREGALLHITCQYMRRDDGTLAPVVNGVVRVTGTLADGSEPQVIEVPLMELLTAQQQQQVTGMVDRAFTALLTRYGLTEA